MAVTFFAAGIVYAAHADYGWSTWVSTDWERFGGLSTEEKLYSNDPGIMTFVKTAKRTIPDNYTFLSSLFGSQDDYVVLRTEYLLLPLRKRQDSRFIIVMVDREAKYDPATRSLSRGDKTISNVDLVYQFSPDAYILRKGS